MINVVLLASTTKSWIGNVKHDSIYKFTHKDLSFFLCLLFYICLTVIYQWLMAQSPLLPQCHNWQLPSVSNLQNGDIDSALSIINVQSSGLSTALFTHILHSIGLSHSATVTLTLFMNTINYYFFYCFMHSNKPIKLIKMLKPLLFIFVFTFSDIIRKFH